jgi:hypothetical protein
VIDRDRKQTILGISQFVLREPSAHIRDSARRIAQKIEKDEIDAELVEKLRIIATRTTRDMPGGS